MNYLYTDQLFVHCQYACDLKIIITEVIGKFCKYVQKTIGESKIINRHFVKQQFNVIYVRQRIVLLEIIQCRF